MDINNNNLNNNNLYINYNISVQQQQQQQQQTLSSPSSNNFTTMMNNSAAAGASVVAGNTSSSNLMNQLYQCSGLEMGSSLPHIKSEPIDQAITSSLQSLTQNTIQNSYTSSVYNTSNNNNNTTISSNNSSSSSPFGHSFMNQLNSPSDLLDPNQVVVAAVHHQNLLNQTINQLTGGGGSLSPSSSSVATAIMGNNQFYPNNTNNQTTVLTPSILSASGASPQTNSSSNHSGSIGVFNQQQQQQLATLIDQQTNFANPQQLLSPPTATTSSLDDDDDEDEEESAEETNNKKQKKKKKNGSANKKSSSVGNGGGGSARKHRKNIAFNDISACFEMPIRDASQILGVSLTQLKRLCREFQIPRWPFRRLNSIQRRIEVLQIMQQRSETKNDHKNVAQTQQEIDKLQREVVELKTNPSPNVSSTLLQDGTVIMNTESSPTNITTSASMVQQDQTYANLDSRSSTTGNFTNPYTGMLQISNSPTQQSFSNMLQMPSSSNPFVDVDSSQKIVLKYPIKNNQQQVQQQEIYQANQQSNFTFQNYHPNNNNNNFVSSSNSVMDTLNMSMNRTAASTTTGQQQMQNFIPSPTTTSQMIHQPNFNTNNNQNHHQHQYPSSPHHHHNNNNNNNRYNNDFQAEFHDYSNHFNKSSSSSEQQSKTYNFHNITFPSAVNNNLQQQMNNLNSMTSMNIGVGNTLPPNMANIDPLMNVNSINHSVQQDNIQNMNASTSQDNGRLYSRRNAASLDALTEIERMQLVNIIAQYNTNIHTTTSTGGDQCNPTSPHSSREEKKNSLIDVLNSRKVSLPADFNAQGVIRKLSQTTHSSDDLFGVENGNLNFGNIDLDNLTTEDFMKLLGDFFPTQQNTQSSNK